MNQTQKTIYAALFLALGLLLPQIFHFFGGTGPVFLPMHIPVLLAGFYLGGSYGALIGLVTPVLSSLLTGMPPVPILYFMMLELLGYGLTAGYLHGTRKWNVLLTLLLSMVVGRLFLAAGVYVLQPLLGLKLSPYGYLAGALSAGVPGMLLQLVVVPTLVKLLEKARSAAVKRDS